MTLEPSAGERAHRNNGEVIANGPLDGRGHETSCDAVPFEFGGHFCVDQREVAVFGLVDELGHVAADVKLEAPRVLVVVDGTPDVNHGGQFVLDPQGDRSAGWL
jgi:hypothetical protein